MCETERERERRKIMCFRASAEKIWHRHLAECWMRKEGGKSIPELTARNGTEDVAVVASPYRVSLSVSSDH